MRIRPLLATVMLLALGAAAAEAQTPAPDRGYIAVKGGLNAEQGEDGVGGTTAAGGAIAGVHVSEKWALEAEFWRPGAIRTHPENGRHRDTLFGVSVRRTIGTGTVRPHFLVGASLARTDDQFTTCTAIRQLPGSPEPQTVLVSCAEPDVIERRLEKFSSGSLMPAVGAGIEIALTERIRLIPDVRLQLWVTAVIVRPAIALGIAF